jgi:GAF domain-containing protein
MQDSTHPSHEPAANGTLARRRLNHAPSEELADLTRGASALLGVSASIVSIVPGEMPYSRGDTFFTSLAEPVQRSLYFTLCFAVVNGERVIYDDIRQAPRQRDIKAFEAAGVGCCACIPLRANAWQVIGLLCLTGDRPHAWTEAELSLINDLAQVAAIDLRREAGMETYSGNELHLRTRRAVMNGLLGADNSEHALEDLLGGICLNLRWDAASAWLSQRERGPGLHCVGRWVGQGAEPSSLCTLGSEDAGASTDMLTEVWMRREPIWISDFAERTDLRRVELAREGGFNTGLWLPLIGGASCLGVIELLATESHRDHDRVLLFALALGRQIGELIALSALGSPQTSVGG